jgi:hypothetical protein
MVSDAYGIPVADVFTGGRSSSGVGGALGSVARFFSPVLRSGPSGAEVASGSAAAATGGSAYTYTSPHYQASVAAAAAAAAPLPILTTAVVLPTEDDDGTAEALRLVEEFERDAALALSASMSILEGTAGRSSNSGASGGHASGAASGGGRTSATTTTNGVTYGGDTMPPGLTEDEQLAWIIALSERTHAAEAQMRTVGVKAPAPTMALQPTKSKSSFFGGAKK